MSTNWCLYILACGIDKSYYVGITNNLSHRLSMHQTKRGSKYTISRWPHIVFLFSVTCADESEARKAEHRVKKLKHVQKEEFMRRDGKVWEWLLSQSKGHLVTEGVASLAPLSETFPDGIVVKPATQVLPLV